MRFSLPTQPIEQQTDSVAASSDDCRDQDLQLITKQLSFLTFHDFNQHRHLSSSAYHRVLWLLEALKHCTLSVIFNGGVISLTAFVTATIILLDVDDSGQSLQTTEHCIIPDALIRGLQNDWVIPS